MTMARQPVFPVDEKARIVLSVLAGEVSVAEAARRAKVSEQSVGNWKRQFLEAGKTSLVAGRAGPSTREAQLRPRFDRPPAGRPRPPRRRPQRRPGPDDRDRQRRPVPLVPVRGVHHRPPRAAPRPHPGPHPGAERVTRTRPGVMAVPGARAGWRWIVVRADLSTPARNAESNAATMVHVQNTALSPV